MLRRDRANLVDEAQVPLEILALETRRVAPVVVGLEIFDALDLSGQESAAERRIRDETDAELAHDVEQLVLGLAAPQRVFGLQRRDRMHGVRAADRLRRRFGK